MGRRPLALRRPAAAFAAVILATVVIDQASKALVRVRMEPMTSIPLVGSLLRLTYVRNAGAAFGMLPGQRTMFVTVSFLVLAGIAGYWWRYRPTHPLVVVALGLVCGGALGNLIDRLFLGRVTDFVEVPGFPVFNAADSAIFVGVCVLVWWLLFGPADQHAHPPAGASAVEPDMTGGDENDDPATEA